MVTNGINNKIRAARRRALRGTERVLNSHGWQTINRQIEYVGKGAAGRRLSTSPTLDWIFRADALRTV